MVKKPKKSLWIVGIDEVGRGPLAGPVCVCAVAMLETEYKKMSWYRDGILLTDSKKMIERSRDRWASEASAMIRDGLIKVSVSFCGSKSIDEKGISHCISSCIRSVLKRIDIDPEFCVVLLDGSLKAPVKYLNQKTVVGGDDKHKIISLASVIAKVRRDNLMKKMHKLYPMYRWIDNKGYGTQVHIRAIKKKGPSPIHRKSFISKIV